ncbi:transposase [Thermus tengchongensis]|uniref:Transposase n=2 Tax=Thermus TaxID=270 RepID=A0ABY2K8X2_9DEIN|nr:transposase [Thermus tengchongensis]TFU15387.1 transposase [Thermus tengchongensis]
MKKAEPLTPQVKFQIALEVVKGERSAVEIARAYGIHPNTVYKYRDELMTKGASLFSEKTPEKEYEKKIRELGQPRGGYLGQLIGKKEVEIALLKKPKLRCA